jgi:hypothetical protein
MEDDRLLLCFRQLRAEFETTKADPSYIIPQFQEAYAYDRFVADDAARSNPPRPNETKEEHMSRPRKAEAKVKKAELQNAQIEAAFLRVQAELRARFEVQRAQRATPDRCVRPPTHLILPSVIDRMEGGRLPLCFRPLQDELANLKADPSHIIPQLHEAYDRFVADDAARRNPPLPKARKEELLIELWEVEAEIRKIELQYEQTEVASLRVQAELHARFEAQRAQDRCVSPPPEDRVAQQQPIGAPEMLLGQP